MREFYLQNNLGRIFRFNYASGVLISSIGDIGFRKENEYSDFDNNYKKLSEKNPIQDLSFTLTFLKGYRGYKEFVDFIESSDSFYLYYKSIEWKYCYVEVEELSKTELQAGSLECNLKLKKLSYWYKDVIQEINIEVDSTGKSYPFTYPYTYSNSISGKVSITNNGYAKAPLRILLSGAFSNPEIIVSKNGETLSSMKIYYTASSGSLEVNAFNLDQKIEIKENGETINAYEYQDFSVDNFLFIPRGTVTLEFKPNVSQPPKCVITMMEGYLSN